MKIVLFGPWAEEQCPGDSSCETVHSMPGSPCSVVIVLAFFKRVLDVLTHGHNVTKCFLERLRGANVCELVHIRIKDKSKTRLIDTFCLNMYMHFVFQRMGDTISAERDIWTETIIRFNFT